MGDLTLRINANFNKAQEAFEELAESSAETREQMEKFAGSITGREIDDFNRKQKQLQASMTGTRGETVALEQSKRNYQREIERLIRNGLAPNSEAVRRLRAEQESLERRINDSRRAQERKTKAMKAAKTALKAGAVAMAGVVTGMIALAKRTADTANGFANAARTVGMTTEAFQELDFAMRMNGIENGEYMLNRLNRSVIDVRNETGTLTKFLKDNYYELLRQLQGVENTEEGFTLLMDAVSRAPNDFARAELAMAAFGRNGMQMVMMSELGAEGIQELRDEARSLGIISNENAEAAMRFNDAMYRLRMAANGMTHELAARLLPAMTNVVIRVTNAVQRFGEFRARMQGVIGTVKNFVPVIASATGGVAAFVAVMKGTTYIKAMVAAIRNLKLMTRAVTIAKTAAKAAKTAYLALAGPVGWGKLAAAAATTTATILAINRAIRNARESAEDFDDTISEMDFSKFNFLAEDVADLDVALTSLAWGGAKEAVSATESATDEIKRSLRTRLGAIEYTANQEKNININTVRAFLLQRAKLESDDRAKREAEIRRMSAYLIQQEQFTANEREAIHRAMYQAIESLTERNTENTRKAAGNMLQAYSVFFGGLTALLNEATRNTRRHFIISRTNAIAMATINTALAVTRALADFPGPVGIVKAIGHGLKGTAQVTKITRTMVAGSGETGGRFIVPPSRGVDNSIMRVNPGEEISVTPRGMTGRGDTSQFIFKVNESVIFDIVNRGGRSGDIHVFEPAANLG